MQLKLATLTALGLFVSATASAQSVGMPVVDTAGNPVGTVTAIQGDNIEIKTDKHDALLPKASFTLNGGKLFFGMTQAQLDEAIEKSQAAADASVVAGATVKGLQGTEIGKVESVDENGVVIALSSGKKIQVARNGVRGNADGTVIVGLTADQIEAATKAGAGAAPSGK